MCPPLSRLYEQLDEYYGDEAPQLKVKTTSEHLIKTPVKPKRLSLDQTTPVRARLDFDDMDEPAQPMEMIEEVDEDAAEAMDVDMEDTEDNNNDFEYGGGGDDINDVEDTADADGNTEPSQLEESERVDGSQVPASQVESEFGVSSQQIVETVDATANAADFFKSRAQGQVQVKDDATAYTMMIENALLRSATSANDDLNSTDDYSYFDVKMLRNWAGPVHWKFPAVRKVQAKQTKKEDKVDDVGGMALMEASDGEDDDLGVAKVTKSRAKKATDHKTTVIDFFAADEPDLKTLLKQPRAAVSITASKITTNRQTQKASELVFPVDSHVEIGVFFQHFMKPKLRFFKRQQGVTQDQNDFISSAIDATYRENDDAEVYDSGRETRDEHDNSGDNFGDEYDYDGAEDADDDLYSSEGLISANRVVEKIDVHYERFAKRVDVKKLKHNIWDHLEKETKLLGDESATEKEAAEVEQLSDDFGARTSIEDTTFESMVQSVSDRVRTICSLEGVLCSRVLTLFLSMTCRFLRM